MYISANLELFEFEKSRVERCQSVISGGGIYKVGPTAMSFNVLCSDDFIVLFLRRCAHIEAQHVKSLSHHIPVKQPTEVLFQDLCEIHICCRVLTKSQDNYSYLKNITIKDSYFIHNVGGQRGGGIYLMELKGQIKMINNHFENNTAETGPGNFLISREMSFLTTPGTYISTEALYQQTILINGDTYQNNSGQASGSLTVRSVNGTEISLRNVTFSGNRTPYGPGGALTLFGSTVITISNSSFTKNTADYGGGVFLESGNCSIIDTTFVSEITTTPFPDSK